jgi:hypothetical protein
MGVFWFWASLGVYYINMTTEAGHELEEGTSRFGYEAPRIVIPGAVVGLALYYIYDTRIYDPIFMQHSDGKDSAEGVEEIADAISKASRHLYSSGKIDGEELAIMLQEESALNMEAQAIRKELPNLAIERAKLVGTGVVPALAVMGLALVTRRFWSRYR